MRGPADICRPTKNRRCSWRRLYCCRRHISVRLGVTLFAPFGQCHNTQHLPRIVLGLMRYSIEIPKALSLNFSNLEISPSALKVSRRKSGGTKRIFGLNAAMQYAFFETAHLPIPHRASNGCVASSCILLSGTEEKKKWMRQPTFQASNTSGLMQGRRSPWK